MSLWKEQLDNGLAASLIEAASDAVVVVNAEGRIVFVNRQGEAMFGYSRAELANQPIEVLLLEGVRALHAAYRSTFMAAPQSRAMAPELALSCRRRDGTELPVEVSLSVVHTQEGLYIAASVRDVSARQLAERKLRDAEERLRLTFDEAPIGMALVGLDGEFLRVNHSLCQIVGYSPKELTELTFQAITHPDDLDADLALVKKLEQGEIPRYQLAKRYIRRDGSVVDAMLSVSIVRDCEGSPMHFISQIEDITERKRAEDALRRSEESLARAQRIARLGSWDWDLRTNEVRRSAELFNIYGVKPNAKFSVAKSLMEFIHPDDRDKVNAAVFDALQDRMAFQVEFRLLRSDGCERIAVTQGTVEAEQGQAVRMVGTVMDITERKQLERVREESLRWLLAVLDQCPVGILLMQGERGEHVEFNKSARALLNLPSDCTPRISDLALSDEQGQMIASENHPALRALQGVRTEAMQPTLWTASGGAVPILLDAAPIRNESGAVQGAVLIFQDITLQKQLERLRAEWSALVAHDLRQPLNSITLTARLLATTRCQAIDLQKPIEQIIQSARRLDRMINDLLDLSRIEVHQLTLSRQLVDLTALVRGSIERFALEAPDRRFEVHAPGELSKVEIDADRITQVMDNLLSNAIKYGTPGTAIEIDIGLSEKEVLVAVTNAGSGIASEELPQLFQRFRRTDLAKRGSIKGTGLGLYIVRELIKAHGGTIKAESKPGEKTTFRFTLPRSDLRSS